MKKAKKKTNPDGNSRTKKRKRIPIPVVLAGSCVVLLAGVAIYLGARTEEPANKEKRTFSPPTSASESRIDFNKLLGRWLRPDGGYVIEVRSIHGDGKLDADYFNPRPINVSKAKASQKGDAVKVFIELYDEGYPGSTYDLTYYPQSDVLLGTYFQAAIRQSFEVVFVRIKQ